MLLWPNDNFYAACSRHASTKPTCVCGCRNAGPPLTTDLKMLRQWIMDNRINMQAPLSYTRRNLEMLQVIMAQCNISQQRPDLMDLIMRGPPK